MSSRTWSQRRRLSVLLALNVAMIGLLAAVGLTAHSLGVLATGGDYLADSLAILLGIIAVTLRDNGRSTRATTYVALFNAATLLAITVIVIAEAWHRLVHGSPEVHGLPVLLAAALATIVMLAGAVLLGRDAHREDLHMRSVLLDTLADAATSAAVAVTGAIIWLSGGLYWLDSVTAILIGLIVAAAAIRLLIDATRALAGHHELDLDD